MKTMARERPPTSASAASSLQTLVLVGVASFATLLIFFHYVHLPVTGHIESVPEMHRQSLEGLMRLVHEQNNTINSLIKTLDLHNTHKHGYTSALPGVMPSATEGCPQCPVMACPECPKCPGYDPPVSPTQVMGSSLTLAPITTPRWDVQQDCEQRYGMTLVEQWKASRQDWCSLPDGGGGDAKDLKDAPSITCYPYAQKHKGRVKDVFCEARNIVLDFSKVQGEPQKTKIRNGDNYLRFSQGTLQSACKKTANYKAAGLMKHQQRLFGAFEDGANAAHAVEVAQTTYFLQRDEDCENAFHSTADFMNMFLVMNALGIKPGEQQVMLFDRHIDGPYLELIKKAFSPAHDVLRAAHYGKQRVLFRHAVFHLESPAGLIFPKVSGSAPQRCRSTGLFQGYRKFVLDAFGLFNVPPPPIPHVVVTLRHRTPSKNVGRIMANEEEVVKVLKGGNMMKLSVVDQARMSYGEQLKLIRSANVLVGVHGAGLMFIMFAAEEAVLVEVHPSYRQDRHFRHAAKMTDKLYMPVRSLSRESCQGSSDNVMVPAGEFALAMDGALRAARSFDVGLSECGLRCPGKVLAIDRHLDPFYATLGERKSQAANLQFPC